MNKYKRLLNGIIKRAAICAGIVAATIGVYLFTGTILSASETKKVDEENARVADQSTITELSNQLAKAGLAEKQFLVTQHDRSSFDFTNNTDTLKEWLRRARTQYRFSNTLKLSLAVDKPVDDKNLSGTNYQVIEHPSMKLEFGTMSDTHVYSFLDDLVHSTPGFVRIDHLKLKRVGDIDRNTIAQMRLGAAPTLVEAVIEFYWIGLKEKPETQKANVTPAGTP